VEVVSPVRSRMDYRLGLDNAGPNVEMRQVVNRRIRGGVVGALGAYGMIGLASNWARYGDLPWQYVLMTFIALVLVLPKPDRGAQQRTSGLPRR
jgi:hypothetical protein